MKKLFVMLAAGAMFVACGGDKKAEEQKNDAAAPAVEVVEEAVVEVEAPAEEADYIATAIELSERAMNAMVSGDMAAFDAIEAEMEAFEATLTPEQIANVEVAVMEWAAENGYL